MLDQVNDQAIDHDHHPAPAAIHRLTDRSDIAEALAGFFAGTIRNPLTRASYMKAAGRLGSWMHERGIKIESLTSLELAAYVEQYPASNATRKTNLAAIRSICTHLAARGLLRINPAPGVRPPRIQYREGLTPVLTRSEILQLIGSVPTDSIVSRRDRALIATCYYSAARISAVLALQVSDLYQVGPRWLLRLGEKGGLTRDIPVHPELLQILADYLDRSGLRAEDPIFPSARGRAGLLRTDRQLLQSDAHAVVKRRAAAIGFAGISPHGLRASAITHILEAGAGLDIARELAGHADISTTMLYDRRSRDLSSEILRLGSRELL